MGTKYTMTTLPTNPHITEPYTLEQIREKLESGDYSAELMVQHLAIHVNRLQAECRALAINLDVPPVEK
jgi:hypothetical protein